MIYLALSELRIPKLVYPSDLQILFSANLTAHITVSAAKHQME
jgi:hypothetical protein